MGRINERGRSDELRRFTQGEIEKEIGKLAKYALNCHVVSLAIVREGFYPDARVARGWCDGLVSQHSWVAVDGRVYSPNGVILDCSLWSYDSEVPKVYYTNMREGRYHPHGMGLFFVRDIPQPTQEIIKLNHLTMRASEWLRRHCPRGLDIHGWHFFASRAPYMDVEAPSARWPCEDIITAIYRDERTKALIPIDRLGMMTDINPEGLYLPGGERKPWLTPRCNVRKKKLKPVPEDYLPE